MIIPAGLRPHFKAISILGVLALIGDAWLSIKFGWSIAAEMAVIAGVISIASGLLLVAALFFDRIGWRWLGRGIAALWVPVFLFNCWSNMGVSTANRMGEVQAAKVQQTTYDGAQANVAEAKRSLDLFQRQLASLIDQNAWAGTVTADGLRAQVADLRKAEAAETRLGGCGQKCRAIQNQISDTQGRIAVAEQRADLTKRIEATKAVIAKYRTTLATTDKGISSTANQSTLYAKLISFNLAADPDAAMVVVANEGTGIGFAVILALIAAALTVAGAWPELMAVSATMLNGNLMQQFHGIPDVGGQSGNRTSAAPSEAPTIRAHPKVSARSQTLGELVCANDLRRLAAA